MRSLLVKCTIQPSLMTFDPRRLVCFTDCTMRMRGILLLGEELYTKKGNMLYLPKHSNKKEMLFVPVRYTTVKLHPQWYSLVMNTVNYLQYTLKNYVGCTVNIMRFRCSFTEDPGLLGCNAIQNGRNSQLHQRNLVLPSSQEQAAGGNGGRDGEKGTMELGL